MRRKRKSELKSEIKYLEKECVGLSDKMLKSQQGRKILDYLGKLRVELMECDFYSYVQGMWHIAPTGSEFEPQWYIECICDHIEMMLDLEFLKLIVSISPRSAKSTIISQLAPTWLWIVDPTESIISASYGDHLVKRDMTVSRAIIDSPKYQENWGNKFKWSKDQNEKKYYRNDKNGFRLGLTPRGIGTGEGCTWLFVDDPHKAQEAQNQKLIEQVYVDWWKGTMWNRYRTLGTFRRVIIHQRLAEYDLAGKLQTEEDDWVVLSLQERFTGQTFIGHKWQDPRTVLGQLLKPTLFDEKAAREKEQDKFNWSAQYMQDPVLEGSSYINLEQIRVYDESNQPALCEFDALITSWDLSGGSIEEDASFTCGICVGILGNKKYILGWEYGKFTFPQQVEAFLRLRKKFDGVKIHLIENHANGSALIDHLTISYDELLREDTLEPINPKDYGGSKENRLFSCLPQFEKQLVFMPSQAHMSLGVQSNLFISHLTGFPRKKEKDFVDALSQVLNYLFLNPVSASNSIKPPLALDLSGHETFISLPFSTDMSDMSSLFPLAHL